ncbi:MAG: DUF3604 domain-containing protein [Blastomonas sp.]
MTGSGFAAQLRTFWLAGAALAMTGCQAAQPVADSAADAMEPVQRAASAPDCPANLYWGDTHLHTANSGDAVLNGTRLTADDAYRFARGDAVTSNTGQTAQLARPLDFLVVADHAELIGSGMEIVRGNPALMEDPTLNRWHDMLGAGRESAAEASRELIEAYSQGNLPAAMANRDLMASLTASVWSRYVDTTERYYQPGRFTTFIGYEFTSTPGGDNLHRIVLFRDGKAVFGNTLPFSALRSPDPAKLWAYLDNYEKTTGGRAMAIPHNGNLSNGRMYAPTDYAGDPITSDYAALWQRWEPIAEATQIKGNGETHPSLSPDDEFASFGVSGWDKANLDGSVEKSPGMLHFEYLRQALVRGLELEARIGVNPFRFGLIGATDSHTGLSSGDEDNYWGKFTSYEPGAERLSPTQSESIRGRAPWQYLAGGYAGVWASANNREAIFDAMQRREVFATTGPRMQVRFFAGPTLSDADLRADPCALYARAAPMGGEITPQSGKAPRFLVSVLKDPDGANLDRVQIVKGWIDSTGKGHERVFDVAWSDPARRKRHGDGHIDPVGDTVNLEAASYANSIGAVELSTLWRDPDYDPAQNAFYYVRALEIPTPRWTAYDEARYGSKAGDAAEMKTQERIFSSPIWVRPAT